MYTFIRVWVRQTGQQTLNSGNMRSRPRYSMTEFAPQSSHLPFKFPPITHKEMFDGFSVALLFIQTLLAYGFLRFTFACTHSTVAPARIQEQPQSRRGHRGKRVGSFVPTRRGERRASRWQTRPTSRERKPRADIPQLTSQGGGTPVLPDVLSRACRVRTERRRNVPLVSRVKLAASIFSDEP